jgi:hypothetical protein
MFLLSRYHLKNLVPLFLNRLRRPMAGYLIRRHRRQNRHYRH